MLFRKDKKKNEVDCNNCKSRASKDFDFCPYCGSALFDEESEAKDFGMLGKNDVAPIKETFGLGIGDKMFGSLVNSLMKTLDKQFREMEKEGLGGKSIPGSIKIQIGRPKMPVKKTRTKKEIILTEEQIKRMSSLPREPAKTKIRRLSDRIVYELHAPGIKSPNDIFISKLENGYEIKAIGEKKVYINSLPVELPIKQVGVNEETLFVEFNNQLEQ